MYCTDYFGSSLVDLSTDSIIKVVWPHFHVRLAFAFAFALLNWCRCRWSCNHLKMVFVTKMKKKVVFGLWLRALSLDCWSGCNSFTLFGVASLSFVTLSTRSMSLEKTNSILSMCVVRKARKWTGLVAEQLQVSAYFKAFVLTVWLGSIGATQVAHCQS